MIRLPVRDSYQASQIFESHETQCAQVYLGVDARCLGRSVAKVVADLFEAESAIDETTRTSVAQGVGAASFLCRGDADKTVVHYAIQRSVGQRAKGCFEREKQDSALAARPSVAKVASDGVADSRVQGISVLPTALGSYYADRSSLPVDIVEPSRPHTHAGPSARARATWRDPAVPRGWGDRMPR